MVNNIERSMTVDERLKLTEDGIPGVDLGKREKTWQEKFTIELNNRIQIAGNKHPIASHIAREDYEKLVNLWTVNWKKLGYIDKPRPTANDLNWDKYTNFKNFDLIKTKERNDAELTKHNPGLTINVETKVYKFKGDNRYTYTLMESGPDAIARAVKKRKELDKV